MKLSSSSYSFLCTPDIISNIQPYSLRFSLDLAWHIPETICDATFWNLNVVARMDVSTLNESCTARSLSKAKVFMLKVFPSGIAYSFNWLQPLS